MAADTQRELEWYLRDHLLRQTVKGRTRFNGNEIPAEMAATYLRFRGYKLEQLTLSMRPIIESLVSRQVLKQTGEGMLELASGLARLQCSKCFYVSYLTDEEPKICQRCSGTELHEFPKRARQ